MCSVHSTCKRGRRPSVWCAFRHSLQTWARAYVVLIKLHYKYFRTVPSKKNLSFITLWSCLRWHKVSLKSFWIWILKIHLQTDMRFKNCQTIRSTFEYHVNPGSCLFSATALSRIAEEFCFWPLFIFSIFFYRSKCI